jgi:chorismate synthase
MAHVLRWITAGESHGQALTAVIEGLPAGIPVTSGDIAEQLARRRLGYGRGARMKFEQDTVTILGGVRHGLTLGGPVAIQIGNTEWPKWEQVMSADPVDADVLAGLARNAPLTRPRPGHADLAGMQKYGFDEARPVLERASARETASRVALGTLAQHFLRESLGAEVVSHVVSIGSVDAVDADGSLPVPEDREAIDESPVRALRPESTTAMIAEIEAAKADGDTLGGVVEVLVYGLPPGLGSFVHADRKLDGRLAAALMGIQAIKGVEIGDGFRTARRRGSAAHDEIDAVLQPGDTAHGAAGQRISRRSNRAGGIEGGMTNGEVLRVRAAMKPISTVPRALATVDVRTGEAATAIHQRSDVCAVPAAGVVAEAMVALVVAEAVNEKFGGDSIPEIRRNIAGYLDAIASTVPDPGSAPQVDAAPVVAGHPAAGDE